MKKLITLSLVLLFIFTCIGCGHIENREADSFIVVRSADILSKPYENFLWAEEWTGYGWLSGDGTGIARKFGDIHNELPKINYEDDFEIHYREGVEFVSLSIYNSEFGQVYHNEKLEVLDELAEGTYYLVITVKVQGEYIEAEDKYEYSGYECAYKMVVANERSK